MKATRIDIDLAKSIFVSGGKDKRSRRAPLRRRIWLAIALGLPEYKANFPHWLAKWTELFALSSG